LKRRTSVRITRQSRIIEPLEQRLLLSRVTFAPVSSYPTGKFPNFVTTADLNGDGNADVITADYGISAISVLLGNGTGILAAPMNFPVGNGPTSIAIADVNGDGKLDLIVTNSGGNGADPNPDRNTISILLGNGDGTFQPKMDLTAGTSPLAVTTADLNGDGHADIIVANRFDNAVGVFLGNGDGTFSPQVEFPTGLAPEAVAVGDLNLDGHPDIVTANRVAGNVSILLGNGDGTFQPRFAYFVGDTPRSVAIADVNLDGFPDIVTAQYNSNSVTVLLGDGKGRIKSTGSFTTAGFPFAVTIADMNLDGRPDILTADQRNNSFSLLLRNFDGTLGTNIEFPVGVAPTSIASADLNNDGKPDVITADFNNNNISVLLNTIQPSATHLIASQSTVAVGGQVQFTAVVTATGTIPRANVQFFDGIKVLRTVPLLADGTATFTTASLRVLGDHSITARYLGAPIPPMGITALAGSLSAPLVVTTVPPLPGQPLLVPILNSVSLPAAFATGDIGTVRVTINNQGSTVARGAVSVQLFASTDQTFTVDDIALTAPIPVAVRLSSGASKLVVKKFLVGVSLAPGPYFILAVLTPISGLLAQDVSTITAFTPLPLQAG
jgi:hypothetical protein